jgi:hypothetical protein
MLTTLKNNKSLTFFQQTSTKKNNVNSIYAGGIGSISISNAVYVATTNTNASNAQLTNYLTSLNAERNRLAQKVAQGLAGNSNYQGARNDGVKLAWDYENADVNMGGKGSSNWDPSQCEEIKQTGRVRGAQGHHQKNVANHPHQQANPDNIKYYDNQKEHLKEGHDGDFRKESNKPMINKDKMLKNTNTKRVVKNELRGLGVAVAIGLGVGMTIGFIISLAQNGITPDSLKTAAVEGAKGGAEAGIMSAVGYGLGRTVGELASNAIEKTLESIGFTITENISKMINMGVVGGLTIAVFSVYQFVKLKRQGVDTRSALLQTGKQALFSLSLLAVSIAAQGLWGGPAGIIVSVSVGIIMISYAVTTTVHQRHFAETVRVYMIDKCYPAYSI